MQYKVLNAEQSVTYALIFETGDEVVSILKSFAKEHSLKASHFTAIGAFSEATLGYFDYAKKGYDRILVREQVEVLSLMGDIALYGDEPKVHAHVVLGRGDGMAMGGHLLEAFVKPTLELILEESPSYLQRRMDPETGIPLIDVSDT